MTKPLWPARPAARPADSHLMAKLGDAVPPKIDDLTPRNFVTMFRSTSGGGAVTHEQAKPLVADLAAHYGVAPDEVMRRVGLSTATTTPGAWPATVRAGFGNRPAPPVQRDGPMERGAAVPPLVRGNGGRMRPLFRGGGASPAAGALPWTVQQGATASPFDRRSDGRRPLVRASDPAPVAEPTEPPRESRSLVAPWPPPGTRTVRRVGTRQGRTEVEAAPRHETVLEEMVRLGAIDRGEAILLNKAILTGDREMLRRSVDAMDVRANTAAEVGDDQAAYNTKQGQLLLAKETGIEPRPTVAHGFSYYGFTAPPEGYFAGNVTIADPPRAQVAAPLPPITIPPIEIEPPFVPIASPELLRDPPQTSPLSPEEERRRAQATSIAGEVIRLGAIAGRDFAALEGALWRRDIGMLQWTINDINERAAAAASAGNEEEARRLREAGILLSFWAGLLAATAGAVVGGAVPADQLHTVELPAFAYIADGTEGPYAPNLVGGGHDYWVVTEVSWSRLLSPEQIAAYLASYSLPGRDPSQPVQDHGVYPVRDARWMVKYFPWLPHLPNGAMLGLGDAMVFMSPDGLTLVNRPMDNHLLEGGQVVRTAVRSEDGTWYVITHGFGNDSKFLADTVNDYQGPKLFKLMDLQMREAIEGTRISGEDLLFIFG